MASTINAKTTGVGGIDATGDASGVLALQTAGVTGLSIDASQKVTFANSLTSPTLVTPVLGTPSSGTLTNCTFPTLNQNTTGNSATATSLVGSAFSAAANGYFKDQTNGLIIQWGSATASAATSGTSTVVTFPLAFPTGLTFASTVCNFAVSGGSSWYLTSYTTTTMTLQRSNNANSDAGTAFKWFAIGY